jgi:predicted ArsR family transcriptional regulator
VLRVADEIPDSTDWRILELLQRDGRASYAELAKAVSMSASAVTERVRRLEQAASSAGTPRWWTPNGSGSRSWRWSG